jgi:hypothetical protein
VRFWGCTLLLLSFTSSAFATEKYTEVWNPPEARDASLHRSTAGHKPARHMRAVQHIVTTRTHRMPAPAPKLAMKEHNARTGATAKAHDLSDIPRQITPEGNVLRVDSRNASAEVTR